MKDKERKKKILNEFFNLNKKLSDYSKHLNYRKFSTGEIKRKKNHDFL